VLNQVGVPGRPEIPAKDFGAALGVHPSLIIPFDAKLFGAAANNGQMIIDAGAKSKAAEAFQTLAQIVSRRELPRSPVPSGLRPVRLAKPESKSCSSGLFKKLIRRVRQAHRSARDGAGTAPRPGRGPPAPAIAQRGAARTGRPDPGLRLQRG
jgi:hypothetical protein